MLLSVSASARGRRCPTPPRHCILFFCFSLPAVFCFWRSYCLLWLFQRMKGPILFILPLASLAGSASAGAPIFLSENAAIDLGGVAESSAASYGVARTSPGANERSPSGDVLPTGTQTRAKDSHSSSPGEGRGAGGEVLLPQGKSKPQASHLGRRRKGVPQPKGGPQLEHALPEPQGAPQLPGGVLERSGSSPNQARAPAQSDEVADAPSSLEFASPAAPMQTGALGYAAPELSYLPDPVPGRSPGYNGYYYYNSDNGYPTPQGSPAAPPYPGIPAGSMPYPVYAPSPPSHSPYEQGYPTAVSVHVEGGRCLCTLRGVRECAWLASPLGTISITFAGRSGCTPP